MKVSFARKYQAGNAITGTFTEVVPGTEADAAAASGGTDDALINPSTSQATSQPFGKYGKLANVALNTIDFGTDLLAAKAWEKQAKEKIKEERELKDAASKSMALRRAALQQASIWDTGGAAMLAASGLSNLAGISLYRNMNPDYSSQVRRLSTGITNGLLSLPPTSKSSAGEIFNYTAEGVAAEGQEPKLVNTTQGSQGTRPSANQTSATGTLGPTIPTGRQGVKLIRRFK